MFNRYLRAHYGEITKKPTGISGSFLVVIRYLIQILPENQ
jgi:hypothetical protein